MMWFILFTGVFVYFHNEIHFLLFSWSLNPLHICQQNKSLLCTIQIEAMDVRGAVMSTLNLYCSGGFRKIFDIQIIQLMCVSPFSCASQNNRGKWGLISLCAKSKVTFIHKDSFLIPAVCLWSAVFVLFLFQGWEMLWIFVTSITVSLVSGNKSRECKSAQKVLMKHSKILQ